MGNEAFPIEVWAKNCIYSRMLVYLLAVQWCHARSDVQAVSLKTKTLSHVETLRHVEKGPTGPTEETNQD